MEITLGNGIRAAAIFDRDYRHDAECAQIEADCSSFCDYVSVHHCKEIENFLLIPDAIDRAAVKRISDRSKRSGKTITYEPQAAKLLEKFSVNKKNYVMAQYLDKRRSFERKSASGLHDATINEAALHDFEKHWNEPTSRLRLVPGKDALSAINQFLQEEYSISLTFNMIIESMFVDEIPDEMKFLVKDISNFVKIIK